MPALPSATVPAAHVSYLRPMHQAQLSPRGGDVLMCREEDRLFEEDALASKRGVATPTSTALQEAISPAQLAAAEARASEANAPIGIIGGGVSGIFAALTLRSLGYHNVTIFESAPRVGGKAGSFEHGGKSFPIGAVSTPFALRESSFTGAQIFEKPIRFAASVVTHSARRLQILDANNLLPGQLTPSSEPRRFAPSELSQGAVPAWKEAFGARGTPDRFYPHRVDFGGKPHLAERARGHVLGEARWGQTHTSWPLIYVSAHGYGVARAEDAPPNYYWARFAQKSTNAAKMPSLGPRGPALAGFDTTRHMESLLEDAGVRVLTSTRVDSVRRDPTAVHVSTTSSAPPARGPSGAAAGGPAHGAAAGGPAHGAAAGGPAHGAASHTFDHLVVAADLRAALGFLDASPEEHKLFNKVRHLNYHTLASHIQLPWMRPAAVYYLGAYQGARDAADAGGATSGCPTILFQPHRESNLTISWAYGGPAVSRAQMHGCLQKTIVSLGGTFGGVVVHKEWAEYFPHVGEADLRTNYHRSLDALQGKRRTTYVGEIFNLPLVSECVDWSRHLIRRKFRDVNAESLGTIATGKTTFSATQLMRRRMAEQGGKHTGATAGGARGRAAGATERGRSGQRAAGVHSVDSAGGAGRRFSAPELIRQLRRSRRSS